MLNVVVAGTTLLTLVNEHTYQTFNTCTLMVTYML